MADPDGGRVDAIEALARGLGGAQEGVGVGWNGAHGYWWARVAIANSRERPAGGRWRSGHGRSLTMALISLDEQLRQLTEDRRP